MFGFSCPSWTNSAGKRITVKSTCNGDGRWSIPIHLPPGPHSLPLEFQKPDGPDMMCNACEPLKLTYNPNEELGAEFHCFPPIDMSKLPIKIELNVTCNLLCDKILIAETKCRDFMWTGNPELGFWCNQKKEAVGTWFDKESKLDNLSTQ